MELLIKQDWKHLQEIPKDIADKSIKGNWWTPQDKEAYASL